MRIPRPDTSRRALFSGLFRTVRDEEPPVAPPPRGPEPKWAGWAWARASLVLTAFLHTMAFPPYNVWQSAYVFAVPAALWTLRRPRWIEFLVVTFGASLVSWLLLLEWLRHVTWGGWFALSVVLAIFPTLWFAAVRYAWPSAEESEIFMRVLITVGLAGLWVLLEWTRSWFLTGFPWLPLAASQWLMPPMLQLASYGGAWMVSFGLILFNLGLAAYAKRLQLWVRERRGRFCPEFYLGFGFLFLSTYAWFSGWAAQVREPLFKAGFVQPYIPQSEKWDPDEADKILKILEDQTKNVSQAKQTPDAIFWPEAVMPYPIVGDPDMQAWVEKLAREVRAPIVLGAVGRELRPAAGGSGGPAQTEIWRNGVFVVHPDLGLQSLSYTKRHLVPFGEYVPLRRFFPNVAKYVPIGGDFQAGEDASPIAVHTGARTTNVGALVCYEDVFPSLARDAVRSGAEVLFVATNDAWYGEAGAAYQHAAHSVLRAVETRRPVLRDGNGGWSGWIDEFGNVRDVAVDSRNTVYFRGGAVFQIERDSRWAGRESTYVKNGDWFVGVCALFVIAAVNFLLLANRRARRSVQSTPG